MSARAADDAAGDWTAEEIAHVLLPRERQVLVTRHHPAVLLKHLAIALGSLILAGVLTTFVRHVPAAVTIIWLLWLVALGYFLVHLYMWTDEKLIITDRRIMYMHGILTHHLIMSPLSKVTDLNLERPWMGKLLGYGTIDLQTSGQFEELRVVHFVPHPESVFMEISSLLFPDHSDD